MRSASADTGRGKNLAPLADRRARQPATTPAPKVPSARAITAWIMHPYGKLSETERLGLKEALAKSDGIAAIAALARGFTKMVRHRGREHLQHWLTEAEQAGIPEQTWTCSANASCSDPNWTPHGICA